MIKKYLFLPILILNTVLYSQVLINGNIENSVKQDSITNLILIQSETEVQIKNEIEKGDFKVLRVDNFDEFYLIFILRDCKRSTIFSEKCYTLKGKTIQVDSTYYFELTCKDTLYNGTCLMPLKNVTYFEKYSGDELGKLYKAKNLCGLNIIKNKLE